MATCEADCVATQPATPNQRDTRASPSTITCFHCRNQGHWAQNCPFNTSPPRPRPHLPSNIPCPYGHGSCFLKISRSQANPGRPYYSCSSPYGSGNCRFFKWVDDQVTDSGVKPRHPLPQDYPHCRCGAGKCKLMLEINGPNAGQYYFVCPIEKGHGACSFRTGVNDTRAVTPENSVLNGGDQVSFECAKVTKFDSPVTDNPNPTSTPLGTGPHIQETLREREEHGDVLDMSTNQDMVVGEEELEDVTVEKTLQVSCLTSETIQRQTEFLRQIYAADDPPTAGVFPSFDPIYVPKDVDAFHSGGLKGWPAHGHLNADLESSPQTLRQDSEGGVLSELSSIKNVAGIREGRDFMGPISKALAEAGLHVQNQLLSILECTDPQNHKSMREAANRTFAVLEILSVEHRGFSERVGKFISCASELAKIEESMKGKTSAKETVERYKNEKAKFHKLSKLHSETTEAITGSAKRVQSLREELSRVKIKLARIENQLRHRKMENGELKARAGKIRKEMVESKKKVEEAGAAKKAHEERSGAKEALERAKFQLRQWVISDNI
ncbi:zinc finger protein [Parasponia andersonii]|uniref:Zinc finger protein n=1 Tax=Parasponia andersonii TaxID=3476 RepID=A0A2P5AG48_PARAD|nr:zinc finger protein [Parasponia andersonii]